MTMHIIFLVTLFIIYFITGGNKSMDNLSCRKRQTIWMGILLFLFAALRSYSVGQDVRGYEPFFQGYYYQYLVDASMSFNDIIAYRSGRDPFFHLFLKLLSFIWPSPQLMLIVIGAIVAFSFSYFTYKEKGNVLLFYIMFIGFRLFSFTLSGLRQATAMSLIFIAYVCFREKKIWKMLLLTLLATLFHRSALIFVLALPIEKLKNYYVLPAFIVGVIIVNFLSNEVLTETLSRLFYGDRFSDYFASTNNMNFGGGATFYIYMAIYFAVFLYFTKMMYVNPLIINEFNILTVGILFVIIGLSIENVFRISYYFIFVLYPIFSQFLNVVFKKRDVNIIVFLVSILLSIQYIVFGTGAGTEEYRFFWEDPYLYA